MTISLTHKFQSAKADGADNSIVQPSDWNDNHELTLAASRLLGRASGTSGAVEEVALGSGLSFSGATLNADALAQTAGDLALAASKTTPVDADNVFLLDSAAANNPKKLSWSNIKATIKTYFDTLYATKTELGTKQNALGYTPVQQGTGVGQSTNTVKIGWSSAARLKVTVDNSDQGYVTFDGHVPRIVAGVGVGGIGGFGFFKNNSGSTVNHGTAVAGSAITYSATGATGGANPEGTWVACGTAPNGQVTVFQRTA